MEKFAVDVVLLPFEEIMDEAIKINKELLKKNPNKIVLNKENCLPHISILMGYLDEDDLPNVEKELQNIAKQFSSLNLKLIKLYADIIPTGEKVSCLGIEKTKYLQAIHEIVVKNIGPYLTHEGTIEMLYNPAEVDKVTLFWINNYVKDSSFEKFFPHITVGFGETNKKFNFPISLTVSKLALCHLGNYCTCRKILLLSELSKS